MKKGISFFLSFFTGFLALAQPNTDIQNQLSIPDPLVIVQDKRTPQTLMSGGNCTVITKEDIQKLPARNVAEVLMNVAGVDVRSRNPFKYDSSRLLYSL